MENLPKLFQECQKSLKATSCDTDQKEYMCSSALPVFDFDALKDWYAKNYLQGVYMTPSSVDALWLATEHLVFIEFKNGKVDGLKNSEIIIKLYDSLLLLLDDKFDLSWCRADFKPNISYTRENMDYILVYSKEKFQENPPTPQTKRGWERQSQDSHHRTVIYKVFSNLGRKPLLLFGLDRFEGYLFRRVYTMDQSEFEQYLEACGVKS